MKGNFSRFKFVMNWGSLFQAKFTVIFYNLITLVVFMRAFPKRVLILRMNWIQTWYSKTKGHITSQPENF